MRERERGEGRGGDKIKRTIFFFFFNSVDSIFKVANKYVITYQNDTIYFVTVYRKTPDRYVHDDGPEQLFECACVIICSKTARRSSRKNLIIFIHARIGTPFVSRDINRSFMRKPVFFMRYTS